MNTKYELVIFDIDGTLIDTAESITKAAKKAIQIRGLREVSMDDLEKCIGPPLAKTMVESGLSKA